MPANSTGPDNDVAPVAVADAFTLTAQQAASVIEVAFSYLDVDPESPTFGQTLTGFNEVTGFRLDLTANDTDANPNDAGHFWIFGLTQPKNAQGVQVGYVALETDLTGHQYVRYYNPTPDDSQATTLTFSYRVGDQWATVGGTPAANTLSAPVTVTIQITGNAVKGECISGFLLPTVLTPDSCDPRIHYGLKGNDTLTGGMLWDTIDGGQGADLIHGGLGNDRLLGGAGADRIYGDLGNDTLNGNAGDDVLTGGLGCDTFVFDYGSGNDTVTDFDLFADRMLIDHNVWGSWQSFIAGARQVGSDVVVTSTIDGSTLTFEDMSLKYLKLFSSDFVFV